MEITKFEYEENKYTEIYLVGTNNVLEKCHLSFDIKDGENIPDIVRKIAKKYPTTEVAG